MPIEADFGVKSLPFSEQFFPSFSSFTKRLSKQFKLIVPILNKAQLSHDPCVVNKTDLGNLRLEKFALRNI